MRGGAKNESPTAVEEVEKVTTFLSRTKLGLGLLSFRSAGLLHLAVSVRVRVTLGLLRGYFSKKIKKFS